MYNALTVAKYIIKRCNDTNRIISNLKLQKLLYFVQAEFLVTTTHACFPEEIEAWDFGPVVPEAYHEYKQYGSGDIPTIESYIIFDENDIWNAKRVEFEDTTITDEDKALIKKVVDKFADYSATDLVSLTHRQSPWIDAYVPYQNNEITINAIREYFNG